MSQKVTVAAFRSGSSLAIGSKEKNDDEWWGGLVGNYLVCAAVRGGAYHRLPVPRHATDQP